MHTAAGQTEPLHSELYDAVMALPQKYRVPLFLYYYEDCSTQEIASMLGIPRATVCTRLKRGVCRHGRQGLSGQLRQRHRLGP